ncbi:MAG: mechanosensitive ion channel [Saprospiraceae bacterium]|nr:mechanosensitive ion channel [Saprospiraceae bacterium]
MEFNVLEIVKEMLLSFAAVIPNFFLALIVFLIGWIISKLVAKFVRKLLKTVGADKLAERLNEIEIIHKSKLKIVPSVLLSKILYYILLFIFIFAATDVLGMEAVSNLMGDLLNYLPNLISAFLVLVIGIFFADFIKNIVLTACNSLGIPAAGVIANIVFYFIFLNVAMITLSQAKIDTDFIQDNLSIILAGVVLAFAIGYGFASREMAANFLSSLYSKDRVKVGDVIGIEGVKGEIIEIDNASFTLKADDHTIIIPISKLTSAKIEIYKKAAPPISEE